MKANKKLLECVAFWRQHLRLDDWKIAIQEAKPGVLEKAGCRAQVDMQPHQREAVVILRSVSKYDTEVEREIVHELLHLVLAQYSLWVGSQEEARQLPMEQSINAIGNALVFLRRGL